MFLASFHPPLLFRKQTFRARWKWEITLLTSRDRNDWNFMTEATKTIPVELETTFAIPHGESVVRADLEPIQLQTAAALHVALRAKHGPAASHSLRVAMYATAWGYSYRLRDTHVHLFEMTGLLHEIGKIGIPDRVLQKPDGLSDQERSMMELQPQVGVEILKAAGASQTLLNAIGIVGQDFSVLPNPQATESWSMAARLIRVIDAFDSMTSRSAYRDPKNAEEAVSELLRNAGSQFDPKLARSFAQMILRPNSEIESRVQEHWNQLFPLIAEKYCFRFDIKMLHASFDSSAPVNNMNDTFYRHMLNNVQQGLIFIDSEFRILQWNKATVQLTGQASESVLHQYWKPSLVGFCDRHGQPLPDHSCPFLAMLSSGERSQQKMKILRADGTFIDVKVEIVPFTNARGKLTGGAIILNDISEQRVLEQTIIHLNERASQDQLTRVANRGELNRQLPNFIKNHADNDPPGAIIICDIDYFKRINDHFSHQAGDEALKSFAALLRDSCRSTDLVARYGGEEFVMLCPRCDLAEAMDLAETLRRKIQRASIPALRGACITASFGVTVVRPGDSEESAMARADRGLLTAKENGRDRVVCIASDEEMVAPKLAARQLQWPEPENEAQNKHRVHGEFLSFVPKAVVYDKLLGFAGEYSAVVTDTQENFTIFEIDCRNAPIPREPNERPGKYRFHVSVNEVELRGGRDKSKLRLATLLQVVISPLNTRERREDAHHNQCVHLMRALESYLVAEPFTPALQADLVRVIKPVKDSRY